jgi:hypothetical protein
MARRAGRNCPFRFPRSRSVAHPFPPGTPHSLTHSDTHSLTHPPHLPHFRRAAEPSDDVCTPSHSSLPLHPPTLPVFRRAADPSDDAVTFSAMEGAASGSFAGKRWLASPYHLRTRKFTRAMEGAASGSFAGPCAPSPPSRAMCRLPLPLHTRAHTRHCSQVTASRASAGSQRLVCRQALTRLPLAHANAQTHTHANAHTQWQAPPVASSQISAVPAPHRPCSLPSTRAPSPSSSAREGAASGRKGPPPVPSSRPPPRTHARTYTPINHPPTRPPRRHGCCRHRSPMHHSLPPLHPSHTFPPAHPPPTNPRTGAMAAAVTTPFDVVKTRLMLGANVGAAGALRQVREQGTPIYEPPARSFSLGTRREGLQVYRVQILELPILGPPNDRRACARCPQITHRPPRYCPRGDRPLPGIRLGR